MSQPVVPREEAARRMPAGFARLPSAPAIQYTVLAVAGVDSGGGAGIAADLNTIAAHRHHGAPVITSVTAQNSLGIQAIYDLPAEFVSRQIESVASDIEIHAAKVGMVGRGRTADEIARAIDRHGIPNVVVDPVLRSTTGTSLIDKAGIARLREQLFPRALVLTPNLDEAGVLAGHKVEDLASMKEAARKIHALGPRHVVVTGGNFGGRAVDVLYDGSGWAVFDFARIASTSTHGIGCTFATAIACQLARGAGVAEAVEDAKRYVLRAVTAAPQRIGRGAGPVNHLVSPF